MINWKCKLGFHKWRRFRIVGNVLGVQLLQRCDRCGRGRLLYPEGAETHYTKAQMDEIEAADAGPESDRGDTEARSDQSRSVFE